MSADDLLRGVVERVGSVVAAPATITLPGADQPFYARDASGRLWVAKEYDAQPRRSLVAEVLGMLLGKAVDAPQPAGAVGIHAGRVCWLSECLGTDVAHFDECRPERIANLDALGRTLWIDVVMADTDRHEANYVITADPTDPDVDVAWAIDRASAAIVTRAFSVEDAPPPRRTAYPAGFPFDAMRLGAFDAANQACSWSHRDISRLVDKARHAAGTTDLGWVADTLVERIERGPALVAALFARMEPNR